MDLIIIAWPECARFDWLLTPRNRQRRSGLVVLSGYPLARLGVLRKSV